MDIIVRPHLERAKGGWVARSEELGLAGSGESESEAKEGLRGVVSSYCRGLAKDGRLLERLRNSGIEVVSNGDSQWQVVVQ